MIESPEMLAKLERIERNSAEAVWAAVFNSTVSNSVWLHDRAFSPRRWAVGFGYLYVLYRILNEVRPTRILDLGLGQTSKMIAQYAAAHPSVEHVIIEADPEWVGFFNQGYHLPANSRIVMSEYEMREYKGESVRFYSGLAQKLSGQRFDLISIDAPPSKGMVNYGRLDVLDLMPEALSPDCVLMMDDVQRVRERNAVGEIVAKLASFALGYKDETYHGDKDFSVICSERMRFLRSL